MCTYKTYIEAHKYIPNRKVKMREGSRLSSEAPVRSADRAAYIYTLHTLYTYIQAFIHS